MSSFPPTAQVLGHHLALIIYFLRGSDSCGVRRITNITLVKQASELQDVKIVTLDWLLDSIDAKKKADELSYFMVDADSAALKDEDKGKKRSRNGKDKAVSPESEEEEQQPPAKKQKDGQTAKSRSLNIPVDEGCNLQRTRLKKCVHGKLAL